MILTKLTRAYDTAVLRRRRRADLVIIIRRSAELVIMIAIAEVVIASVIT